jgi:hypothetical protein
MKCLKCLRLIVILVLPVIGLIFLTCHKSLPVLNAVNLLEPVYGALLRQKRVEFQWQKIDDAIGYYIQIDRKTSFTHPIINDSTLTDTIFTNELMDGNYYWRVRGLSKDSVWGEWSETWSFVIERYKIVSQTQTHGYAHDVFVQEPYAYIADGQAGLTIVDVGDPEEPAIVANIMDTTQEAWGVTVKDSYAYIAYGSVELWVVDVSNLDSINVVGSLSYPTPASGYAIKVRDSLAYIAAMSQFIIANVADPRYPDLLFQGHFAANVRGVALVDTFAVIACEQLGVFIYNVATPQNSNIIGWYDTPGNARDVFLKDSLAFIADGTDGLVIVNIKNKSNPQQVCSIDLPGYARKIYIVDNLLYVALGDSGLGIVDITNPVEPKIDAVIKTGYVNSIFPLDDYIYVAGGKDGLTIVVKEEK